MYDEMALLLFATAVPGVVALRLKQPVIVAYILIGIVAGPSVLDWISAHEPMEPLAGIGVTVLLFVVGLKLEPARLVREYLRSRDADPVSIGSHGRGALSDVLLGSIAQRILETARGDVLLVRRPLD
ncbi:universal stress protein [Marilutibacter chinensis]|uniref:Cation:proton antiporter n=1 Tax=Marilutibacter chinensis TaxID=2912247 RepID=A0ABS9HRS1_9GAMM|nr:cation:proton antiporter [Lysobacter chinensis]MCF7221353.1 cation:proton antiporter [Lysobacter chinensis]